MANLTAPSEIGSWIENIKTFVILDPGSEAVLLNKAARMALGRSASQPDNGGKCVPTIENAAKGAALRARDWVGYWEGYENERLYWEQRDEDHLDTWEREEGEFEEHEEGLEDDENEL